MNRLEIRKEIEKFEAVGEEYAIHNVVVLDLLSKLEIAEKALEELKRYTAPDYPFKSAETIAEFHTLINLAIQQIRE